MNNVRYMYHLSCEILLFFYFLHNLNPFIQLNSVYKHHFNQIQEPTDCSLKLSYLFISTNLTDSNNLSFWLIKILKKYHKESSWNHPKYTIVPKVSAIIRQKYKSITLNLMNRRATKVFSIKDDCLLNLRPFLGFFLKASGITIRKNLTKNVGLSFD